MEQARNLSATVHDTNVANQKSPFWSGLKSTNPAISSLLKSCLLFAQSALSVKFGTKTVASLFSLTVQTVHS
jgi:hypothetical protein